MNMRNYLEELEIIVNSKMLSIMEKQKIIDELHTFLDLNLENKKLEINENIMNDVQDLINIVDPEIYRQIEEKLKSLKAYNKIRHFIDSKLIITLTLTILICALSSNKSIPKTVYMIHILNLISSYFMKEHSTFIIAEEANKIFLDCISNSLRIDSIGTQNFSKQEKEIWRCIDTVINLLIESGFIVVEMTHFFKESLTPFNKKIESHEKRKYSTNMLMLNKGLNNVVNFPILTNVFPTLTPSQINSNDTSEIIKGFTKGEISIDASDELIQVLQFCANIPYNYNYELFKEAVIKVEEPLFDIYINNHLEKLHIDILDSRYNIKAHRNYIKQTYAYEIVQLKCFLQYLKTFELKIKGWYFTVINKIELLRKRRNIDFKIQSKYCDLEIEIEFIIPHLFFHIINKLENKVYCINEILESFVTDASILKEYNFFDKTKIIEAKNEIVFILNEYGLKRICNLNIIFSSYNQDQFPFLSIWINAIKNIQNYDLNLHKRIKMDNILYRWYVTSNSIYSNKINIDFKAKIMEVFQNYWVYFKPHISVNGRLTYQGYAPHPHSGKLFRFTEIKPKPLTKRGLFHIKVALSCSFKNSFETLENHIAWVDENTIFIEKNYNKSISTFVYYNAYQKGLNQSSTCATLLRVDESASALAILACLADCQYFKTITNITNHGKPINTYTTIGNKFILPQVKTLIDKWEMDSSIEEDLAKKFIIDAVREIILPKIESKKFIKYVIMPQAYNLTHEGVKEKLIHVLKEEQPEINWNLLGQESLMDSLSLTIWHGVGRASPKIRKLRYIINKTQGSIIQEIQKLKNQNVYSTTIKHFDCTIKYDYKIKKEIRKEIWIPKLKYSQYVTIKVNSTDVDSTQSKRSLLPMLIQSIDGAIIRKTMTLCQSKNGFTPPTIHDAACCHPNDLDDLILNLKEAFHMIFGENKFTNKKLIESIWLHPTLENLKGFLDEEALHKIKNNWNKKWDTRKSKNIELEEVLINTKDILTSVNHYFYE